MNGTKFGLFIIACLIVVGLTIVGGLYVYYQHRVDMAKAGYEERAVPGTTWTIWVKSDEKQVK